MAHNEMTTAFFEIVKSDKNEDGTLMVYGKATDSSLDIDQQICDPVWLDGAMPEWFKSGGNIREQHSNIAAGVAKEYEKKSDGHYIHALVVDPVSVKKVDTGVLKGFSIGIKSPRVVRDEKAVNGRIIDGQIVEVSLVDRPANPNCQLVLAKSVNGESGVWKVEELIEKSDEVTPETTEVVEEVTEEVVTEEVAVAEETVTEEAKDAEVLEKKEKPNYEGMLSGGSKSEPADKELYNRIVGEAKKKFDVYPSAVANAWVVQEYKKRGGAYKKKTKEKSADIVDVPKSIVAELLKFDKAQYEAAREALANLIAVEANEMKEGHNEINSISHLLESVAHLAMWYEGEKAEGEVEEEVVEMAIEPDEEKSNHDKDEKMHHDEEDKMCDKCNKSMKLCKCNKEADEDEEKSADTEISSDVVSEDLEAIVEKAVKSATESIRSEVASLMSQKEAAVEKAATLESELATAKSLAMGGGPKRTAKPIDANATNDLLTKAVVYEQKANATTDPTLAKGYTLLAKQYRDELNKSLTN